MTNDSKTARDVIVAALTARHEELSGEASPLDFDGASQILRALRADGFMVQRASDVTSVIRNIGEGAGSEHYRYGRETARDDAVRAIEVMFEVKHGSGVTPVDDLAAETPAYPGYATPTFKLDDDGYWWVTTHPRWQIVGRTYDRSPVGWTAFTPRSHYVGLFPDKQAAGEALVKHAGYEVL